MSVYEKISDFADQISQDFDQQLKTVTDLGMKYICIRSAEHKGIDIRRWITPCCAIPWATRCARGRMRLSCIWKTPSSAAS